MKKLIYLLLCTVIVFASCEKDDSTSFLGEETFIGTWEGQIPNNPYGVGYITLTVDSSLSITQFLPYSIYAVTGNINESTINVTYVETEQIKGIQKQVIWLYEGKLLNTTTIEMQLVSITMRAIQNGENTVLAEEDWLSHDLEFILTKNQD